MHRHLQSKVVSTADCRMPNCMSQLRYAAHLKSITRPYRDGLCSQIFHMLPAALQAKTAAV